MKAAPVKAKTGKYYQQKNVSAEQNNLVHYASEISGNDLDFISTMCAENCTWDMYRTHPVKNRNGTTDFSCGLNSKYHWPFIEKLLSREVTPEQIMSYCYGVYKKRPGAFYGYYVRKKVMNRFYLTP